MNYEHNNNKETTASKLTNSNTLTIRKYLLVDNNNSIPQLDFHSTSTNKFLVGLNVSDSVNCTSRSSSMPQMTDSNIGTNCQSSINTTSCATPQPIIFLFVTLLATVGATFFLCFAIM